MTKFSVSLHVGLVNKNRREVRRGYRTAAQEQQEQHANTNSSARKKTARTTTPRTHQDTRNTTAGEKRREGKVSDEEKEHSRALRGLPGIASHSFSIISIRAHRSYLDNSSQLGCTPHTVLLLEPHSSGVLRSQTTGRTIIFQWNERSERSVCTCTCVYVRIIEQELN
jgi:hypothetical protein